MKDRRQYLTVYFGTRFDLPRPMRETILAKIADASDESVRTDAPCVGKHWFVMDFDGRNECPYCEWKLTRA